MGDIRTSHTLTHNDLKRTVTPGTILSVISQLRDIAEETLALAETLTHATSVADLMATVDALQRDIDELERIAADWQARLLPVGSDVKRTPEPVDTS